jgi:hypothetical protein
VAFNDNGIGTAVGAVVDRITGAFTGKAVAQSVEPTLENAHWFSTYDRES